MDHVLLYCALCEARRTKYPVAQAQVEFTETPTVTPTQLAIALKQSGPFNFRCADLYAI